MTTYTFEIPLEDTELKFNIVGDGGSVQSIEGTLTSFHYLLIESQRETLGSEDPMDYLEKFQQKLEQKYQQFNVKLNRSICYKIANQVFEIFHNEKKSIDG